MTDFLLHEAVRPLEARRLPGGILSVADPLPAGWESGITFNGVGCSEPEVVAPCDVTDATDVRPNGQPIFEPVWIRQTAACSRLSHIGTLSIADNRLESTTEWALGRALATGLGSNNPSFADGELVAAQDEAVSALSCLEQAVADVGFGADATLHVSFMAAAYLDKDHLLNRYTPGGAVYSPAGLRVIISSGYPGDVDAEVATIWATGTVFAAVTGVYDVGPVDTPPPGWQTNLDLAVAYRLGMAAFDPCLNLSATFVVAACTGGS